MGSDETNHCPTGVHYPGPAVAAEAATPIRCYDGDVVPAGLLAPCWIAVCGHGIALPDVVGRRLHTPSRRGFTEPGSAALRQLVASGWTISPGGIVHCAPLAPGDPHPGPGAIDLTSVEFRTT